MIESIEAVASLMRRLTCPEKERRLSSKTSHTLHGNELTLRSEDSDILSESLADFCFASFHLISISNTPPLPTDSHYFLVYPMIASFALYDKA